MGVRRGLRVALLIGLAGITFAALTRVVAPSFETRARPARAAPVSIFIVLDTVRADHLSACGYARPTSPFLEEMFERSAFATCRAYAPGTWTLPSHASFFTGLPVETHGAESASAEDGKQQLPFGTYFTPLSDDYLTLAEQQRAEGRRTVLVSANPVLSAPSGLTQGFDRVVVAGAFGELYGESMVAAVRRAIADVKPDDPLLLVVNIADAHNPWVPIPNGLEWLPARPSLDTKLTPDNPLVRYVKGELSEDEVASLRGHYTDVYDYGVRRADETLEGVMHAIEQAGLLGGPHDLVLTSDHGELLAEHGAFSHGGVVWEPAVQVPFVLMTSNTSPPRLTEPFATMEAFRVLLGHTPRSDPPTAVGNPRYRLMRCLGEGFPELTHHWIASWSESEKLVWRDGEVVRYDLARDPAERAPMPVRSNHERERLDAIAAKRRQTAGGAVISAELTDKLRALGYAE